MSSAHVNPKSVLNYIFVSSLRKKNEKEKLIVESSIYTTKKKVYKNYWKAEKHKLKNPIKELKNVHH